MRDIGREMGEAVRRGDVYRVVELDIDLQFINFRDYRQESPTGDKPRRHGIHGEFFIVFKPKKLRVFRVSVVYLRHAIVGGKLNFRSDIQDLAGDRYS